MHIQQGKNKQFVPDSIKKTKKKKKISWIWEIQKKDNKRNITFWLKIDLFMQLQSKQKKKHFIFFFYFFFFFVFFFFC